MAPAKSREREGSSLRRNEKERDGGRQRLPPHADSAPVEWNLLPVSEQSEGDGISYERRICESVVIEKEGFCPSGLINPHWIGKLVWDFGVMFCVLMDAMVLPFQLTFKSNLGADSFDTVWLWTTTWIFGIDIIFSFNCAIESEDGVHGAKSKLILDRVKIAKSYLRGWFAIDFGSTVPWAQLSEAWLSGGSSSQLTRLTKVVKFVRLLRLVRMLRLAKLGQIWERVEHRIGSLFLLQCISLLRVLSVVVAMCHWSACLFWLIGLPRNIFTDVFFSEDEQQAGKSNIVRRDMRQMIRIIRHDFFYFCSESDASYAVWNTRRMKRHLTGRPFGGIMMRWRLHGAGWIEASRILRTRKCGSKDATRGSWHRY